MRRRITNNHARANRRLSGRQRILQPRQLREGEFHRRVHALRRVASALGREIPQSFARFIEARREVPRFGFPTVRVIAIANNAEAQTSGDAAEKVDEFIDVGLRVADLTTHARGAIDEDCEVHWTNCNRREVGLKGNELRSAEVGDAIAFNKPRAARS